MFSAINKVLNLAHEELKFQTKLQGLKHKVKRLRLKSFAVAEEVLMSFGDVELLKIKIIKFINNDIEKINNKFNVNISFIELLSLDDFIKIIESIIVDDLSENEIDSLFDALNSIELISKTNKDKIEELFESLNTIELISKTIKKNKSEIEELIENLNLIERTNKSFEDNQQKELRMLIERLNKKESIKNELIELLSKDEVFNKILSQ